jgi:Na+/phosphate symporter
MAVAILPLVILIAGLLIWALAANAKLAEAGKMMFFCGLLVLTMSLAKETIRFG